MSDTRMKILFIAGAGRSGSTILGNVLGQMPGIFNSGELRGIWGYAMAGHNHCGCGRPFERCPVWQPIRQQLFSGPAAVNAADMRAKWHWANTSLNRLSLLSNWGRQRIARQIPAYLQAQERLWRLIQAQMGCSVLVDSSKLPALLALASLGNCQLYVLHLLRNPRAVAYSWQRQRNLDLAEETPRLMSRRSAFSSAYLWSIRNDFLDGLRRSLDVPWYRLCYEDFVAQPRTTILELLAWLGEGDCAQPFVDESQIQLAPTHTIAGNPVRFQHGTVTITPDVQWRSALRRRDRWVVAALSSLTVWYNGYGCILHDHPA